MKQRWILAGLIIGCFFAGGCSSRNAPVVEDASDQGPERPIVVASISPLAWIAGEMGADLIELVPLMSEGSD
ncbi:MAG: hypothetical protein AAEJ04_10160, partial [Planctomycetota bacterium]